MLPLTVSEIVQTIFGILVIGDPKTVVSMTLKDATLDDILAQLSSQSGVEISKN